jgi:Ca2+-binding RTX toxin-like protein
MTTGANLATGDNVFAYIGRDILLGSTAAQAIVAGHNTSIAVYGELVGRFGISIQADSEISIGATGSAWGALAGVFEDTARNGAIDNEGSIFGKLAGVEFLDSANAALHNSGTILAGRLAEGLNNAGVLLFSHDPDAVLIDNSGFIGTQLAGSFAVRSVGLGVETILNTGTMKGNISLDLGNDFLDTSRGTVTGYIDMGDGNDTVKGSAASDTILGGRGNDSLVGNGGSDIIAGQAGADRMAGNAGADSFYFIDRTDSGKTASTMDRIVDFSHAQHDVIFLSLMDAKAGGGMNDAFGFIGTQAFHKVQGELHYAVKDGNAFVSGDVNGDGAADFTIRLDHVASLVAGDFVL